MEIRRKSSALLKAQLEAYVLDTSRTNTHILPPATQRRAHTLLTQETALVQLPALDKQNLLPIIGSEYTGRYDYIKYATKQARSPLVSDLEKSNCTYQERYQTIVAEIKQAVDTQQQGTLRTGESFMLIGDPGGSGAAYKVTSGQETYVVKLFHNTVEKQISSTNDRIYDENDKLSLLRQVEGLLRVQGEPGSISLLGHSVEDNAIVMSLAPGVSFGDETMREPTLDEVKTIAQIITSFAQKRVEIDFSTFEHFFTTGNGDITIIDYRATNTPPSKVYQKGMREFATLLREGVSQVKSSQTLYEEAKRLVASRNLL